MNTVVKNHSLSGCGMYGARIGTDMKSGESAGSGFTVDHGINIGQSLLDFAGGLITTKNERELASMESANIQADMELRQAQNQLRTATDEAEIISLSNMVQQLQNQIANTQTQIANTAPGGGMVLTPLGWGVLIGGTVLVGGIAYKVFFK